MFKICITHAKRKKSLSALLIYWQAIRPGIFTY